MTHTLKPNDTCETDGHYLCSKCALKKEAKEVVKK